MTNFDFLLSTPAFESLVDVVVAERIHTIGLATCAMKDSRL